MEFEDEVNLISVDDKAKVPIGENAISLLPLKSIIFYSLLAIINTTF